MGWLNRAYKKSPRPEGQGEVCGDTLRLGWVRFEWRITRELGPLGRVLRRTRQIRRADCDTKCVSACQADKGVSAPKTLHRCKSMARQALERGLHKQRKGKNGRDVHFGLAVEVWGVARKRLLALSHHLLANVCLPDNRTWRIVLPSASGASNNQSTVLHALLSCCHRCQTVDDITIADSFGAANRPMVTPFYRRGLIICIILDSNL